MILTAVAWPNMALAYNFTLSPGEWASWPEYCKARYVTTNVGKRSQYASMVPVATVKSWRARLGGSTFDYVHHHCASLVYFQRAGLARSKGEQDRLLRSAESECRFTLDRIPATSPIYRDVAGHMRMVQSLRGSVSVTPR